MIRSIVLLALFLHSISGEIVSKPYSHYTDALKIKCDALPFRTVYFERYCYFVIDADTDVPTTTKRCSSVLSDAKVAQPDKVPDEVWNWLFVDKSSFVNDAVSKGKTKAMCIFENRFPSSTPIPPKTTIHPGANVTARMMMPFLMEIPQALEVGQTITIKGIFSPNGDRPCFNLQNNHSASIALHLAIDFNTGDQPVACLDTMHPGLKWEQAWKDFDGCNEQPFKKGGPFDLRVRLHEDHFQIFTNGEQFGNYKYRLPLSSINTLWISGAGIVTYVQFGERNDPVPNSSRVKRATKVEKPAPRMMMPVMFKFPEAVETDQTIIVKGFFRPHKTRAVFQLQLNDMESVAIHFAVDFNNDLACSDTSRSRNQWDHAYKEAGKCNIKQPFRSGQPFDLRFRIRKDHFQVFFKLFKIDEVTLWVLANEEIIIENYEFRIPLSTINTLGVYGVGIVTFVQLGEKYEPILNTTTDSAALRKEDQKTILPAQEVFANGFPVCGKSTTTCSAIKQYASNVSRSDCKSLVITGKFTPLVSLIYGLGVPDKFDINLKRKNGDIALYFNPRWSTNNVILNSMVGGQWQKEIIVNRLPIKSGEKFEIVITNDAHGFQIFVNGEFFTTFEHRMCPFDIAAVEVSHHVFELNIQL